MPSLLLKELKEFSPATRMIVGTSLFSWLQKMNTDVRVLLNTHDQCISDISLGKTEYDPHHRRLTFTLPITFEELVAKYACDNSDDNIDLLKAKLLTLEGMIHIFTKNLTLAQESFILSLKVLENMSFDMEVLACELYNSIAQLMVTKYRDWNEENKKRVRAECMAWLSSSDGQLALQLEIVKLTKANTKIARRMNRDEIDMKAYKNIYQARVKSKLAGSVDPTVTSVEAASRWRKSCKVWFSLAKYRYLVRSLEIIERSHGFDHSAFAAACIAIASVRNIIGDYEETRAWLSKALRSMDRLDPRPVRAIAFVQTQVYDMFVLSTYSFWRLAVSSTHEAESWRGGHPSFVTEVSKKVRCHAYSKIENFSALFHMEKAREVLFRQDEQRDPPAHAVPIHKGLPVYQDVMRALEQTTRVIFYERFCWHYKIYRF